MGNNTGNDRRCLHRDITGDGRSLELWEITTRVTPSHTVVKYRILLDGILIAWTRHPNHTEERAFVLYERELKHINSQS